ncbi:UNVERIFIED_CONTAM: hypothetical protein Slati_4530800 [Sesamum latifolium]|uniref:Transposase MuDR plant domain-containing protein n=1 Tax=Sesamum latifolium TaxID=2727402 RepID=A0AAW2SG82_9LAMI
MVDFMFSLKFNYGGNFVNQVYIGGKTEFRYNVYGEDYSYYDVLNVAKDLGHPITSVIWFKIPNSNHETEYKILDDIDMDINIPPHVDIDGTEEDENTADRDMTLGSIGGSDTEIEIETNNESDSCNIVETKSCSDDESLGDFDYLAEGDSLSDPDVSVASDELRMNSEYNEPAFDAEEDDIQSDPDVLGSPIASDNEGNAVKFPEFDVQRNLKKSDLEVGLVFANAKLFRKVLRQHCVTRGFELTFEKNESKKVTACCKNKCGWRIHASYLGNTTAFQTKSIRGEPHTCPRQYLNKSANSTYLADRYMQAFTDDPRMTLKAFTKLVRREVNIYAHKQQLYRAKRKALDQIHGEAKQQYHKLRKYCCFILEKNPGSAAIIQCLDAYFLKGPFGGQLMAAIEKDGNNQMFPLAVVVVECECKDSWSWFLTLLSESLGIGDGGGWTFISDRQKALVETFHQLLPSAHHKFCVRHLYANFKLRFKDKELKDLMWAAARSILEDGYNDNMNQINAINAEAYQWLKQISPELWCKFKMSDKPKSVTCFPTI